MGLDVYLTHVLPRNFAMASVSGKHTTILSTKGQFILPKAIRDQRHWAAGTRLIGSKTRLMACC